MDKLEFQGDMWADIEDSVNKINELVKGYNELREKIQKITKINSLAQ